MQIDSQALSVSLFLIATLYAGIGLLVWNRRPGLAIPSFAWMMFSLSVWALGYGLEFSSPLLSQKITWASLEFLGVASVGVHLFTFSLLFTGRRHLLPSSARPYLWVIPLITNLLAWTNPYHHLIWRRAWIETVGGLQVFVAEFGAWFWLQIAYSYTLLFVAFVLLLQEMLRSPMPHRLRAGILLAGIASPWIGSLIYLNGLLLPGIDLTLFFFLPASLLMAWGILRYRLLDILPMAPALLLQTIDDGVLVVDSRQRVLYINRAAAALFGASPDEAFGQPLSTLSPDASETHAQLASRSEAYLEKEYLVHGEPRTFDVRLTELKAAGEGDRAGEKGDLLVFRDIHRRKSAERELLNREAILGAVNLAAQQFLRTDAWEPNLPAFLERLGGAVGADRAFVCRNFTTEDGTLHTRQTGAWASPGSQSPARAQPPGGIPISRIGPPTWSEQLSLGELVTANTSQLSPHERQDLPDQAVLSTTLAPIHVNGSWWGFLGIDDYSRERNWQQAELQALQAAADIVGAAEIRARSAAALQARQRTLSLQHDIVVSALQTDSLQAMADNLMDRLGEIAEADGCLITLWDEDAGHTRRLASSGLGNEIDPEHPLVKGENSLMCSVLGTKAPLAIQDTSERDSSTGIPADSLPFRAALILPLVAGGRPLGAIHLVYRRPRRFQPEETTATGQAAGLIALALEKFLAVEDARRRADESETIRTASAFVVETLRSEETVDRILEQLLHVVPYDSASVQLLHESELEIVGGQGWDDPTTVIGLRFPIPGDNPNTVVIQTGKPYILANAGELHQEFSEGPHSHIRSWMGVPLIVRGRVIGLLAIDSKQPEYFTTEHLKTASSFADHVAIALENARLFEAAEKNTRQQAALLRLSAALSTAYTEAEVYQRTAHGLHEALGYGHIGVFMIEEATGDRLLQASVGWPDAPPNWRLPAGQGISELPILDGQVHSFPDVSREPRYIPGIGGSEVNFPIWIGDRIGAVLVVEDREKYAFEQDDIDLLTVAANLTGLALTRGRLTSSERKQYEELAVLHAMALAIAEAPDEDRLLERATQIIGNNLYPDNFGILLVSEDQAAFRVHPSYRINKELIRKGIEVPLDHSVTGRAFTTGKPQNLGDVTECPYYMNVDANTRSELAVPLLLGRRVIGVINAESQQPDAFSNADERLLTTLAGQLATAIDRLRTTEKERQRTIQLAHSNALIAALGQVAARISSAANLDGVLATLGEELHKLGFTCLVALLDAKGNEIVIRYTSLSEHMVRLFERVTGFGMGAYSIPVRQLSAHVDLVAKPQPAVLADPVGAASDLLGGMPRALIARAYRKIGLTDEAKVGHYPLVVESRVRGFLWLWGENQAEQDLPALSIFANQVAIALENARLFEEVQNLVLTDELTGLYNRRGLFEIGRIELARARRLERPFAALMIDIDHFKQINDTHGHPTGDLVLQHLAAVFQKGLRATDLVGRFGGEEFVILLSDADQKNAREVAERLRAAIGQLAIETPKGTIRTTISVGLAALDQNSPDLNTLIARADQAMYVSKHKGRNRVSIAI